MSAKVEDLNHAPKPLPGTPPKPTRNTKVPFFLLDVQPNIFAKKKQSLHFKATNVLTHRAFSEIHGSMASTNSRWKFFQQVHTKSFQDPLHLQEILDDFGGLFPETTVTVGWYPGSGLPVHRDDCQVGDG